MDQKISYVVLGSSGYLGKKVVARLQKEALKVVEIDLHGKISVNLANFNNLETLELPKRYALINLASILPGRVGKKEFVDQTNAMTTNILKKFKPIRTLFISSTAVYSKNPSLKYAPEIGPWEIYGQHKLIQEEKFNLGFPDLTIFRCATLLDESRSGGIANLIKRGLWGKMLLLPAKGKKHHPFVDTLDVTDNIIRWAENPSIENMTVDLVGDEPDTLFNLISKNAIRPTKIIEIPQYLTNHLGSDNLPIAGISRWHLGALGYDLKDFNLKNNFYPNREMHKTWERVSRVWLQRSA
jgi:nucleoside-diphosphate-sugar epimerase